MRRFIARSLIAGAVGTALLGSPAYAEKVCYVDGPCFCSHDRQVANQTVRYWLPC